MTLLRYALGTANHNPFSRNEFCDTLSMAIAWTCCGSTKPPCMSKSDV